MEMLFSTYLHIFTQAMAGRASICEGCPGQALCKQQGKAIEVQLS